MYRNVFRSIGSSSYTKTNKRNLAPLEGTKGESVEKTYEGFIEFDSYGCMTLDTNKLQPFEDSGANELVEEIENDFKPGTKVFVNYFIGNEKMTLDQAQESLIRKLSGDIDVKFNLDAYSEYTIVELDQDLRIGGHDLYKELEENQHKYAIISIKSVTPIQE